MGLVGFLVGPVGDVVSPVFLLAGFRVTDGQVCGLVKLQHRAREFCELLALMDEHTLPRSLSICCWGPTSARPLSWAARDDYLLLSNRRAKLPSPLTGRRLASWSRTTRR